MRRDTLIETSTRFPLPDRDGEVEQRRAYTREFSSILCRAPMPFAIRRIPMTSGREGVRRA